MFLSIISHALFCAFSVNFVVMAIDYYYYGRLVNASWNIFRYNAIGNDEGGEGGGTGDDLYGVEDSRFYVKNLLLNFNVTLIIAAAGSILAIPLSYFYGGRAAKSKPANSSSKKGKNTKGYVATDVATILAPAFLWLALVFSRPHKEERFLFPIYPSICIAGAFAFIGIDEAAKVMKVRRAWKTVKFLSIIFIALISASRVSALVTYFNAPIRIYSDLNDHIIATESTKRATHVCVGAEWHRFTSHMFLPEHVSLKFIKSRFGGQLPAHFTSSGSRGESSRPFNGMNREEIDRYVGINDCDYVVELLLEPDAVNGRLEPETVTAMNSSWKARWKVIIQREFLDSEMSTILGRVVNVPGIKLAGSRFAKMVVFAKM